MPGASDTNFTESSHKYIVQTQHALLEITMTATTTWFTSDGLRRRWFMLLSWSPELFRQSWGSNTLYASPWRAKWHGIEAPSIEMCAFKRDITVNEIIQCWSLFVWLSSRLWNNGVVSQQNQYSHVIIAVSTLGCNNWRTHTHFVHNCKTAHPIWKK